MNITLVCANIYSLRFGIILLFGSDINTVGKVCNIKSSWKKTTRRRIIKELNNMISEENLNELSYLV